QRMPVLVRYHDPNRCRAAALEGEGERPRFRLEGQLPYAYDRPPLVLDRPDQERGAECGAVEARRGSGAQTPIAVLRVYDEDLLAPHGPDHPELKQMQSMLDAVADADRRRRRAPERRQREAHEPELDLLVDRHTP